MGDTEDTVLLNFTLFIAILSLFSSVFCVITHFLIPKTRRNPGQLVLINCSIQIIIDSNLVLSVSSPHTYFNVIGCTSLGILMTASALASELYLLFFCLEIFILLSKKIASPHTNRVRIYHLVTILLTATIVVTTLLTEGFEAIDKSYCFMAAGSVAEQIFFYIYCIWLISIWIFSILSMKKLNKSHSNLTKRNLITILVSTVFISISFVFYLVHSFESSNQHLKAIFLPFNASIGLTLGIGRLYYKPLLREIGLKLCKKKISIGKDFQSVYLKSAEPELFLNNSLINSSQDHISLSEYFESESLKTLLRIFTCLSLRFSKIAKNLEAYENYNEYYFEEEHFISVLNALSIEDVADCNKNSVYDPNVTVKEIQPSIFKKIRDTYNIEEENLSA
jgi:hypothetical protein